jgi:hypothetical protein
MDEHISLRLPKASEGCLGPDLEVRVGLNHDPKDPSKWRPPTRVKDFFSLQELKRWKSSVWLRFVVDVVT